MFPVCNACQNALTLPDSSSALSIPPTPFWSSLQRFHRQRPLVISRRYRTNKFSSSTMYFVIDEPCTAQLFIGIRHQFPSSDISHFPPWVAAGERPFQPIFSGSAIGFLRHVAQRHDGLRSRHHGSVCALPLLTGKHAIGRVRSSRFARKLPAPAIPRTPPIMLLLPESPLPRCPGLHRTDHLLPGVEGMFAGIERDPARSKPRTAVRPQATSVPITPRSPKRIAVSRETTHETGHKMRARDL